jgi:hypothetical protein
MRQHMRRGSADSRFIDEELSVRRFSLFRARRRSQYLAITAGAGGAALVAALVTQVSGYGAAASASPSRVPTVEETAAGIVAVAERYPGGLPALLELFVTGECAGAESYESATPECRSWIDLIVDLGTGEPVPTSSPDPTTIISEPTTITSITEISEPPPSSTTPPTMTPPTTLPPSSTTPPTMPPPQPLPPLLVAVGDSVTSGHESRPVRQPDGSIAWKTTCDDPATSWAEDLRALLGVPVARYFNFAHSGAKTTDVLTAKPYTNGCGGVSQQARPQIADAIAVLQNNLSRAGAANVAVATAGINNTNWVTVAGDLVTRQVIGFGGAPAWAVANVQACTDYVLGNPAGNATPGAPAGAIPAAWDGAAQAGAITAGVAQIALGLIAADPGAQVRQLLYYRWGNDPYIPRNCFAVAQRSTDMLNGWITLGVAVAQIQWALLGGNATRISAGCGRMWAIGPQNVQMQLTSAGIPNNVNVPGWPHPNIAGRADLAVCVNGLLPRAPGGGVA